MAYQLICCQCKENKDRRDFQIRKGGFTPVCKECRKKDVAERAKITYRIKAVKKKQRLQQEQQRRELLISELKKEFMAHTATNRSRIKAMQSLEPKKRTTMHALEKREKLQRLWEAGLATLIERVENGETVTSLREFMEGI